MWPATDAGVVLAADMRGCGYSYPYRWEHAQNVLAAFSGAVQGYWCAQPELRWDRHARLKVRPAPEPADIIWENYCVGSVSLAVRRAVSWLITLALLSLSAGLLLAAVSAHSICMARERPPTRPAAAPLHGYGCG
jgi:hypothetical protein